MLTAKGLTDEDRRILSGRVEQIVEKGASAHELGANLIRQAVDQTPTPIVGQRAYTVFEHEGELLKFAPVKQRLVDKDH